MSRHAGLFARTLLISALTLVSRLLGFVREVVTGMIFGDASAISDAFFTAWRVPNLFRRLFGEGALSTSLQTAITEVDGERGDAAGRALFLQTLRTTGWILALVTLAAMAVVWFLPDRMPLTDWAWLGADPAPVRDLTLRLLPFVLLVCLAALCGGALHVRGHYAIPNLGPAVMNVVWIAALFVVGAGFMWDEPGPGPGLAEQWRMARFVAWGVLLGGVIQLAMHVPALAAFGLLGGERVEPRRGDVWLVLRTAAPLALGAAVYQVNVMIDGLMAEGLLADGGPSALYYANRIQQFPLALVAVATINAVFPSLKALGHTGDLAGVRRLHDRSQAGILFLGLPAALGLFALAEPVASVLFEHGSYGSNGVARIASALQVLALALLPAGAVGLLGRTYVALGDLATPVRVSIVALVSNIGLNWLFVARLGLDTEGLALATMLSSWLNLALLWPGFARRTPSAGGGGLSFRSRFARMLAAALVAAAMARFAHAASASLLESSDPSRSPLALVAAGLAGVGSYLALAHWFGLPEWVDVRARIVRKLASRPPRPGPGANPE